MTVKVVSPFLVQREFRRPPDGVILHATAGASALSSIRYLKQPKKDSPEGYGYHAVIERDGTIFKCVPYSKATFHAGISKGWNGPNCNYYTLGVCFANLNNGVEAVTVAQQTAAAWLIGQLRKQHDALGWISEHRLVSPGRKSDPNAPNFDIDRFAVGTGLTVWRP